MAENEARNAGHAAKECHVKTAASITEYEFNWTVEKFSWCPNRLESIPFKPFPDYTWKAVLHDSSDVLKMYLKYSKKLSDVSSLEVDFKIQDCNGIVLLAQRSRENVTSGVPNYTSKTSYGYFEFSVCKEALVDLPGDTAIFKCVIRRCVRCSQLDENRYLSRPVHPRDGLEALSNDLKTMYGVSLYADVDVHVGDVVLRAHKSILCARSPVFARMFENPMTENAKNAIEIADVEPTAMRSLLCFLYTGLLQERSFEAVHQLYKAADKYDVSNLRAVCSDLLLSEMDAENACRVLTLASLHCDEELKGAAVDYIHFHWDAVVQRDSWANLVEEEPKLASEVLRCRGQRRTTDD